MLRNRLIFPYKEEVAGSRPASPTTEKAIFCRKNLKIGRRPRSCAGACVQQRCSNAVLAERYSHRVGGLAAHARQHV
jgi:hypothetical protein